MVLSDSLVLPLNVMDYAVDLEVNVRLLQSEYQQLMSDNGMSIGIAKLNFICFHCGAVIHTNALIFTH